MEELNNILELCDFKTKITENTKDNHDIREIIFKYCIINKIIIDPNYTFTNYILYSFDPLIDSNNLCNILYDKFKDNENSTIKYIKLSTLLYKIEFALFDIYNPLIIIKSALIKDKNLLYKKINFNEEILYKNMYIKTYPKFIQYLFNESMEIDIEYIKHYFRNNNSNEDFKINLDLINIRRNIFHKLNNVIWLDYYALNYNKTKEYKLPINVIYHDYKELFRFIYLNCSFNGKVFYKYIVFNNLNLLDYRFLKISIYAEYNNKSYHVMNIYNETSYNAVECLKPKIIKNNNLIPSVHNYHKYIFINIIYSMLYSSNKNIYINHYLKILDKFSDKNRSIEYRGIYKDLNYSKKLYNNNFQMRNYIPMNEKKLRKFE